MVQPLDTLIITMIATVTMTGALVFLPALVELKKPKDAGPRLIAENLPKFGLSLLKIPSLSEDESSDNKLTGFLSFIPNLEA